MINAGSWKVETLQAERFRLDGGAMFGVVPKPLWNKSHPADEKNRITMVTRCLLARGEGRVVLVDTGMGADWSDKEKEIYAIENGEHSILSALAARQVTPDMVTDVILTHLHFDHAGGAVTRGADGLAATFPNARYHVQESQLLWALQPTEKDRRSFRYDTFMPLKEQGRLTLVNGAAEIVPGIHVEPTTGHTIGHQFVRIGEGPGAVVYCGDLIPTAAHVPIPWVMGYDLHPLTTMQEKRALLERSCREEWSLVMEHDPRFGAVRVRREGDGFAAAGSDQGID